MESKAVVNRVNKYQCPFYGFYLSQMRVLIDQNGNQCALVVDSYSPCKMEIKKETPSWSVCPFNNTENKKLIEELVNSCTVFLREDYQGTGMPMKKWMDAVMSDSSN